MQPKFKRVYLPKVKILTLIGVLTLTIIVITRIIILSQNFINKTGISPSFIFKILFNSGVDLNKSQERTNILVLGISGTDYKGGDLTDSILVMSLNKNINDIALISVPRDVWSNSLKDKINSAFHYGQLKKPGGGLILSKVEVEDIIGLPVHYSLIIDFQVFKTMIDLIDGIDVYVPVGFVDEKYPIAGKENDDCNGDPEFKCRFETVSFTKGHIHMNGDTALKYVRSRQASGAEGTDFARSERQQAVLIALKDKMLGISEIIKLRRNLRILSLLRSNNIMDMTAGEFISFLKVILLNRSQIRQIPLSDQFMVPPSENFDNKYVLIPKTSIDDLQEYIYSQVFNTKPQP